MSDWSDVRRPNKGNTNKQPEKQSNLRPKFNNSSNSNKKPDNETPSVNKVYRLSTLIAEGACIKCLNDSCRDCVVNKTPIPDNMKRLIKNPSFINGFGDSLNSINSEIDGNVRYSTCLFCFKGSCKSARERETHTVDYNNDKITLCLSAKNQNNIVYLGAHIDIIYEEKGGRYDVTIEPVVRTKSTDDNSDTNSVSSVHSTRSIQSNVKNVSPITPKNEVKSEINVDLSNYVTNDEYNALLTDYNKVVSENTYLKSQLAYVQREVEKLKITKSSDYENLLLANKRLHQMLNDNKFTIELSNIVVEQILNTPSYQYKEYQ